MQERQERKLWTKEELSEAIQGYRQRQDYVGLGAFFAEVTADDTCMDSSLQAKILNEYGLLLLLQENSKGASVCFEKAAVISSKRTAPLYNLGTLKMRQGELDEALQCFAAVLERDEKHFSSLFNSALCCLHLEKIEKGLEFLYQAVELKPEDGQTRYLLGESLMQLGRIEEALPHFIVAEQKNDGHFESAMGLAIAFLKTGKYQESAALCDQILLLFGQATLPLQVKGDAMLELEEFNKAAMCHVDLCRLDLDIRDFVAARLQRLAEENPSAFMDYAQVVSGSFPSLKPMLEGIAGSYKDNA